MSKGDASRTNIMFTPTYIEKAFATWELHNHPNVNALIDMLEVDENGRRPEPATIMSWKTKYGWELRSGAIQVETQKQTDRQLVQVRMDMMKRHADLAKDIENEAWTYLKETGFDSSASAVSALFKAIDEEKKSTGMGIALAQVFTMSDEDLQKHMNRLLLRARGIEEDDENTVTAESEDIDAVSNIETPDE
jgi:hypothetical protein